jgi:hypothetical protein
MEGRGFLGEGHNMLPPNSKNENMNTEHFQKLIQAATGRPLTIHGAGEEIPLESFILIRRPYGGNYRGQPAPEITAFEWKTPKKDDSMLRSFLAAFFARYKEPDPTTYDRNCPVYGDTWAHYADKWIDPATHWTCAPWGHHAGHMLTREKLHEQVRAHFAGFDSGMARLGFYATNYGIGIFTIYGGQWIRQALDDMGRHLSARSIPYRNELSEAGWVTRFVIGLDKPHHADILGTF